MSERKILRGFYHENQFYNHAMDDNDNVVLRELSQGQSLLVYLSNNSVITQDNQLIGSTSSSVVDGHEIWIFTSCAGEIMHGPETSDMESLIDFEVDISKWYITKTQRAAARAKAVEIPN